MERAKKTIAPVITTRKNARGRIEGYTATIGKFDGYGKTAAAAVADLQVRIERYEPPQIRNTRDGSIWILYNHGGFFVYQICRPQESGFPNGGSAGSWDTSNEAMMRMKAHMAQYNGDFGARADADFGDPGPRQRKVGAS